MSGTYTRRELFPLFGSYAIAVFLTSHGIFFPRGTACETETASQKKFVTSSVAFEERVEAGRTLLHSSPDAYLASLERLQNPKKDLELLTTLGIETHTPHLRHLTLYRASVLDGASLECSLVHRIKDLTTDSFERGYALEWLGLGKRGKKETLFDAVGTFLDNEYLAIQAIEALNYLGSEQTQDKRDIDLLIDSAKKTQNIHIAKHLLFALQFRSASAGKDSRLTDILATYHDEFAAEKPMKYRSPEKLILRYQEYRSQEEHTLATDTSTSDAQLRVEEVFQDIRATPDVYHFVLFSIKGIKTRSGLQNRTDVATASIHMNADDFSVSDMPSKKKKVMHEVQHSYDSLALMHHAGYGHFTEERAFSREYLVIMSTPTIKDYLDWVNLRLSFTHWIPKNK